VRGEKMNLSENPLSKTEITVEVLGRMLNTFPSDAKVFVEEEGLIISSSEFDNQEGEREQLGEIKLAREYEDPEFLKWEWKQVKVGDLVKWARKLGPPYGTKVLRYIGDQLLPDRYLLHLQEVNGETHWVQVWGVYLMHLKLKVGSKVFIRNVDNGLHVGKGEILDIPCVGPEWMAQVRRVEPGPSEVLNIPVRLLDLAL
jgi:hypothetical protein